jgi:alpha-glucosidase (family GH31 glycosyl hydrolase)
VKSKLKYIPTGRDLEYKSMALDTTHANGYIQLDTHSYYGTQMVKASHEWFTKNNKRTFIIERSSVAGAGKFASRWLGDNFSTVSNMAYSVTGVMLMNMFGITLAGSDICGFIGDTNPALCAKWHIVGAFYPFSRNHNNWGQISQEPWVFANDTVNGKNATEVMKNAIKTKYMMIRYYYTNLFQISAEGTGTFYKPMFFEFPDDDEAYKNVGYNVMLGSALKLSINAASLTTDTTEYYFPSGVWCSVDGSQAIGECFNSTTGVKKNFSSTVTDYQLHIREGYIVPM